MASPLIYVPRLAQSPMGAEGRSCDVELEVEVGVHPHLDGDFVCVAGACGLVCAVCMGRAGEGGRGGRGGRQACTWFHIVLDLLSPGSPSLEAMIILVLFGAVKLTLC